MAVARLIGLVGMDILAVYTMYAMLPYLTDVWGLGLTHAAGILNVFWGLTIILPLFWKFINDTILKNYWVLFTSSAFGCAGLGLLWMSSPPVLSKIMQTCSEYKPDCVGHEQRALFYTALALILLGFSGHLTSWNVFMDEQIKGELMEGMRSSPDDEEESLEVLEYIDAVVDDDAGCARALCLFFRVFLTTWTTAIITSVAVFVIPYIKPWSIRFGIPAIFGLVATLVFVSGSCSYKSIIKPRGSPLTTFARVFAASVTKLFYRTPRSADKLYEKHDVGQHLLPHTKSLRFLDKAAIVIPTQPQEDQQKNRWRLCRVTEVEETKIIVRAIPVWMTFIFGGVVASIGTTYFVEQLDQLNPKLGRLKLPTLLFMLLYVKVREGSSQFYSMLKMCCGRSYTPSIGIIASMVISMLCCITAAKVENRRLGVVQMHGLVDKPDERVPMTMFWMLPQFILLGVFEGVFNSSKEAFFVEQFPQSTRPYLPYFLGGVSGLGNLGSVLSVFVVGKVSERGGKMNWFQHNLNGSRLDKYYWTLAWLMAINLVIFIVAAILYRYMEPAEEEYGGGEAPTGDDSICFCFC